MQLPNLENQEKQIKSTKLTKEKSANTTAQRHTGLDQMDPTEYHEKVTIRKPQVYPVKKSYKSNTYIPR